MKTLILNGSPRKSGHTVNLINKVIDNFDSEYKIVNTYNCGISPCIDCRYCWRVNKGADNLGSGKVKFYQTGNKKIEMIYCKDSDIPYPIHTHRQNYSIGFVVDGIVTINKETKYRICSQGDYFVIPPHTPHSIVPKKGRYSLLTICLNKDYINLHTQEETLLFVKPLIRRLMKKEMIPDDQLMNVGESIDYLYCRRLNRIRTKENDMVVRAKALLEDATDIHISIKELSEQVYISPYHLIRSFKKQFGLTPHQFLMQSRIRKAQELLLKGKSMTEVALSTGFFDQSHFIKLFRKMLGIKPSEYIQVHAILADGEQVIIADKKRASKQTASKQTASKQTASKRRTS